MASDPNALAKIIGDTQESALRATEAARSNPFNAVYIAQKQTLTSGAQVNISHGLGVPWAYAYVIHAYPGAGPMFGPMNEAALPSGQSKNNMCSVIPYGDSIITGTVTLTGGTKTVTNPAITSASVVTFSIKTPGGTLGWYQVSLSNGSFIVNSLNIVGSANGADTSTLYWTAITPSTGTYDILIAGA